MSTFESRSLLDRLVAGCLALLVSAAALYGAVKLIEAIWSVLIGRQMRKIAQAVRYCSMLDICFLLRRRSISAI